MTVYEAILLGGIQGLTEFLPVSSSGHLVLTQHWLGIKDSMVVFDIVVHWGTLLAVMVYFWQELLRLFQHSFLCLMRLPFTKDKDELYDQYPYALTAGYLVLSTLATFIMGLLFYQLFDFFFRSVFTVGVAWIVMGIFLFKSRDAGDSDRRPLGLMNHRDAFLIGIAQGIALIPGVSRSGATILMALYCGLDKKDAARYSFLLAFPTILGVGILKFQELMKYWGEQADFMIAGFVAAAAVGYLAIFILIWTVQKGKLHVFGYYCLILGVISMISSFL